MFGFIKKMFIGLLSFSGQSASMVNVSILFVYLHVYL